MNDEHLHQVDIVVQSIYTHTHTHHIHVLPILHSSSMSTPIDVIRAASEPTVTRSAGWNDPPILSNFNFSQTPQTSLPGRNTSGTLIGGRARMSQYVVCSSFQNRIDTTAWLEMSSMHNRPDVIQCTKDIVTVLKHNTCTCICGSLKYKSVAILITPSCLKNYIVYMYIAKLQLGGGSYLHVYASDHSSTKCM